VTQSIQKLADDAVELIDLLVVRKKRATQIGDFRIVQIDLVLQGFELRVLCLPPDGVVDASNHKIQQLQTVRGAFQGDPWTP
jgi:hypothetical protein